MPIYIYFLVAFILLCILLGFCISKKKVGKEKSSVTKLIIDGILFCFSLFAFIVSLVLFRNLGVYVNEYGSSPVLVFGGWFWLWMNVARLAVLFIICLISGVRLIWQLVRKPE